MDFEITAPRDALFDAVSTAITGVDRKAKLPILGQLHLDTDGIELFVRGQNLTFSVESRIPAEIRSIGSLCLNAKLLYGILRDLPSMDVRIASEKSGWATLQCGFTEFEFGCMFAGQFPERIPIEENTPEPITLRAGMFRDMLKKLLFIPEDEPDSWTGGVLLVLSSDSVEAVASDRARLVSVRRPLTGVTLSEPITLLVPKKALEQLERILANAAPDAPLFLTPTGRRAEFKLGDSTLTTALIEGRFPNYQMILPKDNDKVLDIEKGPFLIGIRRVSLVVEKGFRPLTLEMDPKAGDGVVLVGGEGEGKGRGRAKDRILGSYQDQTKKPAPFSIIVHAGYLKELLESFDAEKLQASFKSEKLACLITEPGDEGHLAVLMPQVPTR